MDGLEIPPCPLCESLDIQLLNDSNPSKRSCKCRGCGCSAPATSWGSRKEKPYKLVGYIGWVGGEQKFTEDRNVAGMWYEVGAAVSALFERVK